MELKPKDERIVGQIRKLQHKYTQEIAAGQKIGDVETIVRELIENSLDAGAKSIEIRLSKFGADVIEVEDDGCGIEEANFHAVAQRYHTSKIEDFENLQEELKTFGFRGEALNCLSTIGELSITTKALTSSTGFKLTFKNDGLLSKKERVARSRGTTVTLKNIFHKFPVRRAELENSVKRKYDKIIRCIHEQKLGRPQVRFALSKRGPYKKEKDFVLSSLTLEGALMEIFGEKVMNSLLQIKKEPSPQEIPSLLTTSVQSQKTNGYCSFVASSPKRPRTRLCSRRESKLETSTQICVEEPSSDFFPTSRKTKAKKNKPNFSLFGYISIIGQGKTSTDSQYLFVNRKPCDIPKVTKLINDTYKKYSITQSPFLCLFISVEPWAADFNVPSKRTVILQDEHRLLDVIQTCLDDLYSSTKPAGAKDCSYSQIPINNQHLMSLANAHTEPVCALKPTEPVPDFLTITEHVIGENAHECMTEISANPRVLLEGGSESTILPQVQLNSTLAQLPAEHSPKLFPVLETEKLPLEQAESKIPSPSRLEPELPSLPQVESELFVPKESVPIPSSTLEQGEETDKSSPRDRVSNPDSISSISNHFLEELEKNTHDQQMDDDEPKVDMQPKKMFDKVTQNMIDQLEEDRKEKITPQDQVGKFNYDIDPKFNVICNDELKLQVNKEHFKEMKIIDQHASDERYNYEDQLKNSSVVRQDMVHPKPLYLSTIQENTIADNLEYFEARGFKFRIDMSKIPGLRVQMISTSTCKGYGTEETLNKDDIIELIDILTDSPQQAKNYVLKKVKAFSAMRACRKSTMIGDKLSFSKMKEIVKNMSKLNNPWICAHGRPTIRHLIDTDYFGQ